MHVSVGDEHPVYDDRIEFLWSPDDILLIDFSGKKREAFAKNAPVYQKQDVHPTSQVSLEHYN